MFLCQVQLRVDKGKEEPVQRILRSFSMVKGSQFAAPGVLLVDVYPLAPDAATLAQSVFRKIGYVKDCVVVGS